MNNIINIIDWARHNAEIAEYNVLNKSNYKPMKFGSSLFEMKAHMITIRLFNLKQGVYFEPLWITEMKFNTQSLIKKYEQDKIDIQNGNYLSLPFDLGFAAFKARNKQQYT